MSVKNGTKSKERQRVETIYWAGVLIWAGAVFGLNALGFLPQVGNASPWSWVFLGAGVIGGLWAIFRLISTAYTTPPAFDYLWGGIFLLIGISGFITKDIFWPLILILVGVVYLVSALWQRKL
jgi:hypothetical protein